ncbi:MAG: diguanylate cyclase [Nitrospirota bacterium]
MKVLIAETTAETKGILGRMLQDEGYSCCFVRNGCDIIDRVYHEAPDVIFLPAHLSDACSLKILEKLKSAPSTRDIPVILISMRRGQKTLARGYQLGAYDYISRPYFKEEVIARLRNILYLRRKSKEIEEMMDHDYLTGLYNRNFFTARLNEELSWSACYHEPLSVMMLDIDHFKRINDTHGHRCGDEVLRHLAEILLITARREDITGRYGGEEFIILMSNTGRDAAAALGEELRNAVQGERFFCREERIPVTISIGIATSPGLEELQPDTIIGQADRALYAAKESGRNRVCFFDTLG